MNKSNNVLFKQTISMLECVHNASNHINRCIANRTTGVIDLENKSQVKNRIVEYAALYFVQANYYSELVIECEDLVNHYNKPIDTVIKKSVGVDQLSDSEYASILKCAKKLVDLKIQSEGV